eukprot:5689638-Amphidinium_carterae.1
MCCKTLTIAFWGRFDKTQATEHLPKLVIFDLDGVCWSPEMYQMKDGPPYTLVEDGQAVLNAAGELSR